MAKSLLVDIDYVPGQTSSTKAYTNPGPAELGGSPPSLASMERACFASSDRCLQFESVFSIEFSLVRRGPAPTTG